LGVWQYDRTADALHLGGKSPLVIRLANVLDGGVRLGKVERLVREPHFSSIAYQRTAPIASILRLQIQDDHRTALPGPEAHYAANVQDRRYLTGWKQG
jgi:hypothetical protein